MNLEEKAILADQVIEPFDLVQLQQNIRLTFKPGLSICCEATREGIGTLLAILCSDLLLYIDQQEA